MESKSVYFGVKTLKFMHIRDLRTVHESRYYEETKHDFKNFNPMFL